MSARSFLRLWFIVVLSSGCGDPEPIDVPCRPAQDGAYPDGIPYVGVHANARNDDVVDCALGRDFQFQWHVLKGHGLIQPNTFSPDGTVTYATTTNPEPDGCRAWAIDVQTGETRWCQSYPPAISASAMEVDSDGNLYVPFDQFMISLDPATGEERWRTEFDLEAVGESLTAGPLGLHFTADGHIATIASTGDVYLVRRSDGEVLAELSIPDEYGFVPPTPLSATVDLTTMLPDSTREDITSVYGDPEMAGNLLGAFLGAGGEFSDNTIAVSPRGELYAIGGGLDGTHGALVQLKIGGTAEAPTLSKGWYVPTNGGSATSPSVSRDGRYVNFADGASVAAILNPRTADTRVKLVDVDACDANTDANDDPNVCAEVVSERSERGPMAGAPALLEDGTTVFWELGFKFGSYEGERDLVAFGPDGLSWELTYPDELENTSVVTVTDNYFVVTGSRIPSSDARILSVRFPATTESELLFIDRATREIVERHPITDDSAASVTRDAGGSGTDAAAALPRAAR